MSTTTTISSPGFDALAEKRADGGIVLSDAWEAILGEHPDEILGRRTGDLTEGFEGDPYAKNDKPDVEQTDIEELLSPREARKLRREFVEHVRHLYADAVRDVEDVIEEAEYEEAEDVIADAKAKLQAVRNESAYLETIDC